MFESFMKKLEFTTSKQGGVLKLLFRMMLIIHFLFLWIIHLLNFRSYFFFFRFLYTILGFNYVFLVMIIVVWWLNYHYISFELYQIKWVVLKFNYYSLQIPIDFNLVITTLQINFRKHCGSMQLIKHIVKPRVWEPIFYLEILWGLYNYKTFSTCHPFWARMEQVRHKGLLKPNLFQQPLNLRFYLLSFMWFLFCKLFY